MPDPHALAFRALGLQTCISTTWLSLGSPVCHLFPITFFFLPASDSACPLAFSPCFLFAGFSVESFFFLLDVFLLFE